MDGIAGIGAGKPVSPLGLAAEIGVRVDQQLPADKLESAKFKQLLDAAKEAFLAVELHAMAPTGGLSQAMNHGLQRGKQLSHSFEHAIDHAMTGMSGLDFTDPRSLVTVMEHHLAIMSAGTYIQFATKAANSASQAVKTLFTSQG